MHCPSAVTKIRGRCSICCYKSISVNVSCCTRSSVAVQDPLNAIGVPCADNNKVPWQSAAFSAGKFAAFGFSIQTSWVVCFINVEPSANGVTVEEVTALYPCPVFGTTVQAAARLLITNAVAREKTNVFKTVIAISYFLLNYKLLDTKWEPLGCQSQS